MSLSQLMVNEGPEIDYSEDFRTVMETHVEYLKNHSTTDSLVVQPNLAYKYENSFYDLLSVLEVSREQHWITMRVNGMTSPTEYTADMTELLIVDSGEYKSIKNLYRTMAG